MNINSNFKTTLCGISFLGILVLCMGCSTTPEGRTDVQSIGRIANIEPDYSDVEISPNIAPLNFSIKESGKEYFVRIRSKQGDPIRIQNSSGNIQIPMESWKRLLAENLGQQLILDIFMKNQADQWIHFDSVVNRISQESMDAFLVYRRFGPLFNNFRKMGIFQRNLENFDEKPILLNRLTSNNCMNCHNFWQNGTDRWLLHMRGGPGTSMLLVVDGKVRKIDTKTKFNGPTAYPAWHPSGELIAFSVSKLHLFFHQTGECRDVIDRYSDIVLYDISTNTITTTPEISSPDRMEIWPTWSPDGKFLYFCSAPKIETFENLNEDDNLAYEKIKYDLMRIAYDPVNRIWGKLETVISSTELGLSITEPRVSPDGRFVLFTAAQYSQFPIYLPSADLYLLDLTNGRWKKMEINSDRVDSFHSWSSNSRWIVFSSKRHDGLFTMPYFSHIDSSGNASKPFVLPQEDPSFYETSLELYNVPEFTKEPIHISPHILVKAAFSEKDALIAKLDPNVIQNKNSNKAKSDVHIQIPLKQNKMKR
jgi:hypothetical protein